jgi:hypothetical protein
LAREDVHPGEVHTLMTLSKPRVCNASLAFMWQCSGTCLKDVEQVTCCLLSTDASSRDSRDVSKSSSSCLLHIQHCHVGAGGPGAEQLQQLRVDQATTRLSLAGALRLDYLWVRFVDVLPGLVISLGYSRIILWTLCFAFFVSTVGL